jgi:lipid A disaccharide synthetase
VRELIQHECNPTLIREELNTLLVGGKKREKQLKEYEYLIELLGNGSASGKVAASICK